jgi:hypothetical protein
MDLIFIEQVTAELVERQPLESRPHKNARELTNPNWNKPEMILAPAFQGRVYLRQSMPVAVSDG